jgi:hypothetical protein
LSALPSSLTKLTVTGFKNFSSIESNIFQLLPNLEKLCLSNNAIERTEQLDSLDHLNTLRFDKIQPGVESRLKVINLSGNQLSFVPKRSVSNFPPSLVELDLSKNKIVDIESGAFKGMFNLRSLDLAGNPFMKLDLSNIIYFDTVSLQFLDICGDANRSILWRHDSSQQKEDANLVIEREQCEVVSKLPVVDRLHNQVFVQVSYKQREANKVALNEMVDQGLIYISAAH